MKKFTSLMAYILCMITSPLFATTYTFTGNGAWTDPARWSPSYPGNFILAGDIVNITSGSIASISNGTVNIGNNGTINILFNAQLRSATDRTINNMAAGIINISGALVNNNIIFNQNIINNNGFFDNAGKTFNNLSVFNNGGLATLDNLFNGIINNSGTFTNEGNITGPGTINNTSTFIVNYSSTNQTANISGTGGTISSTVVGTNMVFYVNANLTGQTLNLGISSASIHDKVDVSSFGASATLGGALNLNFTGGYTPTLGTTFTILNGAYTGTFGTINLTGVPLTTPWYVTYNATNVVITIGNNALPLVWNSFTCKVDDDRHAALNWTVKSESNCLHYVVEKSQDALLWDQLAIVELNSAKQEESTYEYIDKEFNGHKTFYRIKQVDLDGKYTYSVINNVEAKSNVDISIYPNPCQNDLFIDIPVDVKSLPVEIFSLDGRLLIAKNITSSANRIQLSNLIPGMYILKTKNSTSSFIKK
jgi:hypothetical protein